MIKICIINIVLTFVLVFKSIAQNDPEALRILEGFSSAAISAPSVSIRFKLITIDQAEDYTKTSSGSLIISGDKYKLDLQDNIIWFNGETSWNYLPEEMEVTITKPDKNDNSFLNRPSNIFTMYKKDFRIRLVEEKTDSYVIDLYPEDIKSEFIRIRLAIGKANSDLKSIEYKTKNGLILTVNVIEYSLKQNPEGSSFVFNPENYSDVEIVDMR